MDCCTGISRIEPFPLIFDLSADSPRVGFRMLKFAVCSAGGLSLARCQKCSVNLALRSDTAKLRSSRDGMCPMPIVLLGWLTGEPERVDGVVSVFLDAEFPDFPLGNA